MYLYALSYLLILASDEHCSDTDQLQVLPHDVLLREEPVDEVVREEERLRDELELEVHLNEPIDENRAHSIIDVALLAHIVGWHRIFRLGAAVVRINVIHDLGDHQRVVLVKRVNIRERRSLLRERKCIVPRLLMRAVAGVLVLRVLSRCDCVHIRLTPWSEQGCSWPCRSPRPNPGASYGYAVASTSRLVAQVVQEL